MEPNRLLLVEQLYHAALEMASNLRLGFWSKSAQGMSHSSEKSNPSKSLSFCVVPRTAPAVRK